MVLYTYQYKTFYSQDNRRYSVSVYFIVSIA